MAISIPDSKPELAKYELKEQIGHGGMATVYRAVDRRLGRDVAVKLIHPHLRDSAEVATRFVSEARAVAMLKHPNIVEVYDISDEAEPERYLVVELIRGPTLRELINRRKAIPPEIAAIIGLEVAAALGHAHEQGIVHRDIKPENVLIELPRRTSETDLAHGSEARHVEIKLTDFGIAKLLDAQGVTSTGQVLGSPAHMAPEQIEGGDVGARADVFGLGVLLYECMVGRLPFDGKNPAQVLRRVLDGIYEPASKSEAKVGARYSAILSKALARNAADRHGSIEELASELKRELDLVGFVDAIDELDRFVCEPDAYAETFVSRVIEGLVRSAERAREEADFALASAQLNRALAYRPADRGLLARVSAVSRGRALRRGGRWVAAIAAGGALAASGLALWPRSVDPPVETQATTVGAVAPAQPGADPSGARGTPAGSESPQPTAAAGASSATPALSAEPAPSVRPAGKKKVRRRPPTLRRPTEKEKSLRAVKILVDGPKGGCVVIDGERRLCGFTNKPIALPTGSHTFEFVAADKECCETPSRTVVIEEGDGVQQVVLVVRFKDAVLAITTPKKGKVTCEFFQETLTTPRKQGRRIPMSDVKREGLCTFSPQDPFSRSVNKHATLRAGHTTYWP